MHPTLRLLFLGVRDERSSLFRLSGNLDELALIWHFVKLAWAEELLAESLSNRKCIAFAHVDMVEFPESTGRDVNMMPFVMFDRSSLPEDLQCYWPMIRQCTRALVRKDDSPGKPFTGLGPCASLARSVGYLTVQESVVSRGASQRRPGLHTEGFTRLPSESGTCLRTPFWHGWGFGKCMGAGEFEGGIFMASNVDDSCHVYDTLVPPELVGRGGDISHLRDTFHRHLPAAPQPRYRREREHCACPPPGSKGAPVGDAHVTAGHGGKVRVGGPISMQENELYWITDRTPHESMPLAEGTHRQYFRLVAGKVDVWFAAHSTPNPLGTLPDAPIFTADKFTGRVPQTLVGSAEDGAGEGHAHAHAHAHAQDGAGEVDERTAQPSEHGASAAKGAVETSWATRAPPSLATVGSDQISKDEMADPTTPGVPVDRAIGVLHGSIASLETVERENAQAIERIQQQLTVLNTSVQQAIDAAQLAQQAIECQQEFAATMSESWGA